MKPKLKLKKKTTVKLNPRTLPKSKVDKLAASFLTLKQSAADAEAAHAESRETILNELKDQTPVNNVVTVFGTTHAIRRTDVFSRPSVDTVKAIALLKKKYKKHMKQAIKTETVTQETFDEEAFVRLVEEGKVSGEDAQSVVIPGGARGSRLSVELIRGERPDAN